MFHRKNLPPPLSPVDQITKTLKELTSAPHVCGPQGIVSAYSEFTALLKRKTLSKEEEAAAKKQFEIECGRCYKASILTVFDPKKSYEESFNAFVVAEFIKNILGRNHRFPVIEINSSTGVDIIPPIISDQSDHFVLMALSTKLALRMMHYFGAGICLALPDNKQTKRKLGVKSHKTPTKFFTSEPTATQEDRLIIEVIQLNRALSSKMQSDQLGGAINAAVYGSQVRLPKTLPPFHRPHNNW